MIITPYIPLTAFILGLIGSVHCAAMCGGVSGYLQQGSTSARQVRLSLAMSFGRIASYGLAGGLAAFTGGTLFGLLGPTVAQNLMQVFVGLFLVLLGISLTGWLNGLSWVEKQGYRFWNLLKPLVRHVLPADTVPRAFAAGTVWGWLPCGLVYSALVLVVGAGDWMIGSLSMIAFGIGTLPAIGLIGIGSKKLKANGNQFVRQSAGALVLGFGAMIFTGLLTTAFTQ